MNSAALRTYVSTSRTYASKRLQKRAPRCPKSSMLQKGIVQILALLPFRLSDAPRRPASKRAPRRRDPTGIPECHTFVMEICEEIALPPRSTLGTSKNNFLEPFELQLLGPKGGDRT